MKALLVVDLQNDFLPGGALAVRQGDEVVPVIDKLLHVPFDFRVATKDWHPPDHGSFARHHGKVPGEHIKLHGLDQILWPDHCVQGSAGADFAPGWDVRQVHKIFYKGTDRSIDSYSAFFDNEHHMTTGLHEYLKEHKVSDLYIAGLATDYCIKYSVLDACRLGFNVFVVEDACRGVDLDPGDSKKALEDMRSAGAHIISSKDVLSSRHGAAAK